MQGEEFPLFFTFNKLFCFGGGGNLPNLIHVSKQPLLSISGPEVAARKSDILCMHTYICYGTPLFFLSLQLVSLRQQKRFPLMLSFSLYVITAVQNKFIGWETGELSSWSFFNPCVIPIPNKTDIAFFFFILFSLFLQCWGSSILLMHAATPRPRYLLFVGFWVLVEFLFLFLLFVCFLPYR